MIKSRENKEKDEAMRLLNVLLMSQKVLLERLDRLNKKIGHLNSELNSGGIQKEKE